MRLIEPAGEAAPYELKQAVSGSPANLWPIQHAQLYSEPDPPGPAGEGPREPRPALRSGIGHGRGWTRFWEEPA